LHGGTEDLERGRGARNGKLTGSRPQGSKAEFSGEGLRTMAGKRGGGCGKSGGTANLWGPRKKKGRGPIQVKTNFFQDLKKKGDKGGPRTKARNGRTVRRIYGAEMASKRREAKSYPGWQAMRNVTAKMGARGTNCRESPAKKSPDSRSKRRFVGGN